MKPPFTLTFINQSDSEGRRTSQVICEHTPDEITTICKQMMEEKRTFPVSKIEALVLTWAMEVYFSENCCCPTCFAEEVKEKGWDPIDAMHAVYSLAKKGWITMLEVPDDNRPN